MERLDANKERGLIRATLDFSAQLRILNTASFAEKSTVARLNPALCPLVNKAFSGDLHERHNSTT